MAILTQLTVKKAKPRGRRYEIPDGSSSGGLAGFSLRVGETGAKSYVLRVRVGARQPRITIGSAAELSLAEARQRARQLVDQARAGALDLTSDRRPARRDRDTVASVVAQYLELHQKRNRLRRADDVQRMFKSAILPVLGDRAIQSITRRDVLDLVDGIAGRAPVMANRVLSLLKRLFSWAVERGILEASPVAGMKPAAKERSRERVLTDAELGAVWTASEALQWPHGPIARLLILTGARRSEVCGMAWSELDLDKGLWVKPGERTKSGRPHALPLPAAAVELIRALPQIDNSALLFPSSSGRPVTGLSGPKARLDELSGVEAWTYHDLRRTTASGLAALGVPDLVVAAVLDHSRAGLIGVGARYNRHRFEVEQRAALERWGAHVLRLATGSTADIVPLRGARSWRD